MLAAGACPAPGPCRPLGDSPAALLSSPLLPGHVGALEGEPKAAERQRGQGRRLAAPNAVPGEHVRHCGMVGLGHWHVPDPRLGWEPCALPGLFVAVLKDAVSLALFGRAPPLAVCCLPRGALCCAVPGASCLMPGHLHVFAGQTREEMALNSHSSPPWAAAPWLWVSLILLHGEDVSLAPVPSPFPRRGQWC